MNHGNVKTDLTLTLQYGSGMPVQRQMNDDALSAEERLKAKDAQDRARTAEERGYTLQMS